MRVLLVIASMLCSLPAAADELTPHVEWPTALALGYQGSPTLGLGLVTAGFYDDSRSGGTFIDATFYVELLFDTPTLVAPTITADVGVIPTFVDAVFLAFGGSVAMPTDFTRSGFVVAPRAGLASDGGIIRVMYSRNFAITDNDFEQVGDHKVMLELNVTSLHHMKIGF